MEAPIDNSSMASQVTKQTQEPKVQEPQAHDINRASRIPCPQRQRTRSRTGSLLVRSGTRNQPHLPVVPDTEELHGKSTVEPASSPN